MTAVRGPLALNVRADERAREAERESKLVDVFDKARYLISMRTGMTVRRDGEEWALDFAQEHADD